MGGGTRGAVAPPAGQAQRSNTTQQDNNSGRPGGTEMSADVVDHQEFTNVDDLQKHNIGMADITKLKEAGLTTAGLILKTQDKDLLAIKGFSDSKVEKIKAAARKVDIRGGSLGSSYFRSGAEVREQRENIFWLTTGCRAFDAILGGGLESASITEAYGEFRTGKTQLAHTLAVTSQLAKVAGGGEGKCIYVDTEGNFRPKRIETIAERFGLDPTATLENIVVARAYSHDQQMDMLGPMAGLMTEAGPFSLIIVDSVIALFRVEFSGRGELSERQQKLGRYLAQLLKLADEFNLAVFLVNQCQADPGAMSMFGPVMKPVGGNILAHASTTRIHLKKGREDARVAKLVDSPSMPEAEASFRLTDGGVDDAS